MLWCESGYGVSMYCGVSPCYGVRLLVNYSILACNSFAIWVSPYHTYDDQHRKTRFLNLSFAQWNGSLVGSVICSWPRYEAVCRTPANSVRNTLDKTRGPDSNTFISTQVKHTKVTRHAFLLNKLAILVWGQPKPVSKSKKARQGTSFMSMRPQNHVKHNIQGISKKVS